jgi:hypothetical protein
MEDVNIQENQENEREQNFRERVLAAQQAKRKAKQGIKNKVMSPVSQASKNALRWAWFSLIPSFGLSLIYINMHVFLRWIFPSAFCKLGDEWVPKIAGMGEHSAKNVAGTAFGIVEIMGLLMLDLLLIFIIISILGLLSLIVSAMEHPLKAILDLGWGGVKAIIDLF